METASVAAQAVEALPAWMAGLAKWDFYATMTYDPTRPNVSRKTAAGDAAPPSASACRRHVERFMGDVQHSLHSDVAAVIALEHTRAGWPHFHALLAVGGQTQQQFRAVWRSWYEPRGFIKLSRIQLGAQLQIAKYCSKYLVKTDGDLYLLGPLGSHGFVAQSALAILANPKAGYRM